MNKWFNDFATKVSSITGRSYTFIASLLFVIIWAISGPLFHYSDTWQLIINTSTTVLTFLVVFIIQNSTNRAANAQQIKLDFILQVLGVDDKDVRQLENLDDKQLEKILTEVQENRRKADSGTTGKQRKTRSSRAK
jgi:low affinity Fe/Cu permease